MRYMDDNGAKALAAAIIQRTCQDLWHSAVPKKYKKRSGMTDKEYDRYVKGEEYNRKAMKTECEAFFTSEWFKLLRDGEIDGEVIVERIKWMRRHNKQLGFADDAA